MGEFNEELAFSCISLSDAAIVLGECEMVKVMAVDPAGLRAAGTTLRSVAIPEPPPPVALTGTDSAATAVASTLPTIESPVIDRLPALQAALTQTGSNIASAAAMYAEIDQTLGENFGQLTAPVSQIASQVGVMAAGPLQTASQLGLTTALPIAASQAVAPLAQNLIQTAQSAAGGASGAGPIPAQLTSDSGGTGQSLAGPTYLAGETDRDGKDRQQQPDAQPESRDGHTRPGHQTPENISTQDGSAAAGGQPQAIPPATSDRPPTPVQPVATPSAIEL